MKPNVYDEVVTRVLNRVEKVSDRVSENFKNVKPFDKKEVPKSELAQWYDQLGTQDMDYLVQKHGRELVSQFIYEMETYKGRAK